MLVLCKGSRDWGGNTQGLLLSFTSLFESPTSSVEALWYLPFQWLFLSLISASGLISPESTLQFFKARSRFHCDLFVHFSQLLPPLFSFVAKCLIRACLDPQSLEPPYGTCWLFLFLFWGSITHPHNRILFGSVIALGPNCHKSSLQLFSVDPINWIIDVLPLLECNPLCCHITDPLHHCHMEVVQLHFLWLTSL